MPVKAAAAWIAVEANRSITMVRGLLKAVRPRYSARNARYQ